MTRYEFEKDHFLEIYFLSSEKYSLAVVPKSMPSKSNEARGLKNFSLAMTYDGYL